jgi:acyl dehydratase
MAGDKAAPDARPSGQITDEAVATLRQRIGIPEPHPQPPHYFEPGLDAFRHVLEAYGDNNPLYSDPDYASKSRWEGLIASPVLVGGDTLIGEDEVSAVPEEHRALMKGDPLRGVHAFYAASFREWWAPLRPGHRISRRNALVGINDKSSEFAQRAVHEWTGQVFADDSGTLLSGQYRMMARTERGKARERKKYAAIEQQTYTDEQIAEIDAQYASEQPRGAEPRWWEDVSEGDPLGSLVKGPLTVTDMICWHVGMGMGLYGIKPLRLGARVRARIPRFYHRDEFNIPDVMQRVHWDPEFARKAGNPTTYDYGRMRETWLIHACTDWMGDDAWLWKLDCEFRAFNYVGDTQWIRGTVARKYLAEGGRPAVDLDIQAINQRGAVTTPGHATILLPSREHGSVQLPEPPGGHGADLAGALAAISERFDDR